MDESLERQLSQEGRLDSHGVFTLSLEQAQLKWSRYALHESVESSLFLVRCFVALGCRRLEIDLNIPGHWVFSTAGGRAMDVVLVHRHFQENGLSKDGSAESYLAQALLGMGKWPLVGASWHEFDLLGRPASHASGLVLMFEETPVFPKSLWRQRLRYCPMEVKLGAKVLTNQADDGLTPWLEIFLEDRQSGGLHMKARPECPALCYGHGGRLTPSFPASPVQGPVALSLRADCQGPSRFVPVIEGVNLRAFEIADCGEGLLVAFDANGLQTDLIQSRLIQGEELQARLRLVFRLLPQALEDFKKEAETRAEAMKVAPMPSAYKAFLTAVGGLSLCLSLGSLLLGGILAGMGGGLLATRRALGAQELETRRANLARRVQTLRSSLEHLSNMDTFTVHYPLS
ncbi:MAG: hypothetical protein U0931_07265 [Vulcanimicrobiota bacterium]